MITSNLFKWQKVFVDFKGTKDCSLRPSQLRQWSSLNWTLPHCCKHRGFGTELKITEWKTTVYVYIGFISKKHCHIAKDCFSRWEFVQQTADCVGARWLQKNLFFLILQNFCEIINFVFHKIFLEFHDISWNSNKFCQNFVFRKICTMLFCSNPM